MGSPKYIGDTSDMSVSDIVRNSALDNSFASRAYSEGAFQNQLNALKAAQQDQSLSGSDLLKSFGAGAVGAIGSTVAGALSAGAALTGQDGYMARGAQSITNKLTESILGSQSLNTRIDMLLQQREAEALNAQSKEQDLLDELHGVGSTTRFLRSTARQVVNNLKSQNLNTLAQNTANGAGSIAAAIAARTLVGGPASLALMGAGEVAPDATSVIDALSTQELLDKSPEFSKEFGKALASGMDAESAAEKAKKTLMAKANLMGIGLGAATAGLGGVTERAFLGKAADELGGGLAGKLISKTALGKEIAKGTEEATESLGEAFGKTAIGKAYNKFSEGKEAVNDFLENHLATNMLTEGAQEVSENVASAYAANKAAGAHIKDYDDGAGDAFVGGALGSFGVMAPRKAVAGTAKGIGKGVDAIVDKARKAFGPKEYTGSTLPAVASPNEGDINADDTPNGPSDFGGGNAHIAGELPQPSVESSLRDKANNLINSPVEIDPKHYQDEGSRKEIVRGTRAQLHIAEEALTKTAKEGVISPDDYYKSLKEIRDVQFALDDLDSNEDPVEALAKLTKRANEVAANTGKTVNASFDSPYMDSEPSIKVDANGNATTPSIKEVANYRAKKAAHEQLIKDSEAYQKENLKRIKTKNTQQEQTKPAEEDPVGAFVNKAKEAVTPTYNKVKEKVTPVVNKAKETLNKSPLVQEVSNAVLDALDSAQSKETREQLRRDFDNSMVSLGKLAGKTKAFLNKTLADLKKGHDEASKEAAAKVQESLDKVNFSTKGSSLNNPEESAQVRSTLKEAFNTAYDTVNSMFTKSGSTTSEQSTQASKSAPRKPRPNPNPVKLKKKPDAPEGVNKAIDIVNKALETETSSNMTSIFANGSAEETRGKDSIKAHIDKFAEEHSKGSVEGMQRQLNKLDDWVKTQESKLKSFKKVANKPRNKNGKIQFDYNLHKDGKAHVVTGEYAIGTTVADLEHEFKALKDVRQALASELTKAEKALKAKNTATERVKNPSTKGKSKTTQDNTQVSVEKITTKSEPAESGSMGTISAEELAKLAKEFGLSPEEAEEALIKGNVDLGSLIAGATSTITDEGSSNTYTPPKKGRARSVDKSRQAAAVTNSGVSYDVVLTDGSKVKVTEINNVNGTLLSTDEFGSITLDNKPTNIADVNTALSNLIGEPVKVDEKATLALPSSGFLGSIGTRYGKLMNQIWMPKAESPFVIPLDELNSIFHSLRGLGATYKNENKASVSITDRVKALRKYQDSVRTLLLRLPKSTVSLLNNGDVVFNAFKNVYALNNKSEFDKSFKDSLQTIASGYLASKDKSSKEAEAIKYLHNKEAFNEEGPEAKALATTYSAGKVTQPLVQSDHALGMFLAPVNKEGNTFTLNPELYNAVKVASIMTMHELVMNGYDSLERVSGDPSEAAHIFTYQALAPDSVKEQFQGNPHGSEAMVVNTLVRHLKKSLDFKGRPDVSIALTEGKLNALAHYVLASLVESGLLVRASAYNDKADTEYLKPKTTYTWVRAKVLDADNIFGDIEGNSTDTSGLDRKQSLDLLGRLLDSAFVKPNEGTGRILYEPADVQQVFKKNPGRLTDKQRKALQAFNKKKYYLNKMMAHAYSTLGRTGLAGFLGLRLPQEDDIPDYRTITEGRLSVVDTGLTDLLLDVNGSRAELLNNGEGRVRYFESKMSSVNRIYQSGSNNPRANKIIRETRAPYKSSLDLTNKAHELLYKAAILQRTGSKIGRMSAEEIEAKFDGLQNKNPEKFQELMHLVESLGLNETEFNSADAILGSGRSVDGRTTPYEVGDKLGQLFDDLGLDRTNESLHAMIDLSRYLQDPHSKDFNTFMYIEADGITDGFINSIVKFNVGKFDDRYLALLQIGGVSFTDIESYREMMKKGSVTLGANDIYSLINHEQSKLINKYVADAVNGKGNPDVSPRETQARIQSLGATYTLFSLINPKKVGVKIFSKKNLMSKDPLHTIFGNVVKETSLREAKNTTGEKIELKPEDLSSDFSRAFMKTVAQPRMYSAGQHTLVIDTLKEYVTYDLLKRFDNAFKSIEPEAFIKAVKENAKAKNKYSHGLLDTVIDRIFPANEYTDRVKELDPDLEEGTEAFDNAVKMLRLRTYEAILGTGVLSSFGGSPKVEALTTATKIRMLEQVAEGIYGMPMNQLNKLVNDYINGTDIDKEYVKDANGVPTNQLTKETKEKLANRKITRRPNIGYIGESVNEDDPITTIYSGLLTVGTLNSTNDLITSVKDWFSHPKFDVNYNQANPNQKADTIPLAVMLMQAVTQENGKTDKLPQLPGNVSAIGTVSLLGDSLGRAFVNSSNNVQGFGNLSIQQGIAQMTHSGSRMFQQIYSLGFANAIRKFAVAYNYYNNNASSGKIISDPVTNYPLPSKELIEEFTRDMQKLFGTIYYNGQAVPLLHFSDDIQLDTLLAQAVNGDANATYILKEAMNPFRKGFASSEDMQALGKDIPAGSAKKAISPFTFGLPEAINSRALPNTNIAFGDASMAINVADKIDNAEMIFDGTNVHPKDITQYAPEINKASHDAMTQNAFEGILDSYVNFVSSGVQYLEELKKDSSAPKEIRRAARALLESYLNPKQIQKTQDNNVRFDPSIISNSDGKPVSLFYDPDDKFTSMLYYAASSDGYMSKGGSDANAYGMDGFTVDYSNFRDEYGRDVDSYLSDPTGASAGSANMFGAYALQGARVKAQTAIAQHLIASNDHMAAVSKPYTQDASLEHRYENLIDSVKDEAVKKQLQRTLENHILHEKTSFPEFLNETARILTGYYKEEYFHRYGSRVNQVYLAVNQAKNEAKSSVDDYKSSDTTYAYLPKELRHDNNQSLRSLAKLVDKGITSPIRRFLKVLKGAAFYRDTPVFLTESSIFADPVKGKEHFMGYLSKALNIRSTEEKEQLYEQFMNTYTDTMGFTIFTRTGKPLIVVFKDQHTSAKQIGDTIAHEAIHAFMETPMRELFLKSFAQTGSLRMTDKRGLHLARVANIILNHVLDASGQLSPEFFETVVAKSVSRTITKNGKEVTNPEFVREVNRFKDLLSEYLTPAALTYLRIASGEFDARQSKKAVEELNKEYNLSQDEILEQGMALMSELVAYGLTDPSVMYQLTGVNTARYYGGLDRNSKVVKILDSIKTTLRTYAGLVTHGNSNISQMYPEGTAYDMLVTAFSEIISLDSQLGDLHNDIKNSFSPDKETTKPKGDGTNPPKRKKVTEEEEPVEEEDTYTDTNTHFASSASRPTRRRKKEQSNDESSGSNDDAVDAFADSFSNEGSGKGNANSDNNNKLAALDKALQDLADLRNKHPNDNSLEFVTELANKAIDAYAPYLGEEITKLLRTPIKAHVASETFINQDERSVQTGKMNNLIDDLIKEISVTDFLFPGEDMTLDYAKAQERYDAFMKLTKSLADNELLYEVLVPLFTYSPQHRRIINKAWEAYQARVAEDKKALGFLDRVAKGIFKQVLYSVDRGNDLKDVEPTIEEVTRAHQDHTYKTSKSNQIAQAIMLAFQASQKVFDFGDTLLKNVMSKSWETVYKTLKNMTKDGSLGAKALTLADFLVGSPLSADAAQRSKELIRKKLLNKDMADENDSWIPWTFAKEIIREFTSTPPEAEYIPKFLKIFRSTIERTRMQYEHSIPKTFEKMFGGKLTKEHWHTLGKAMISIDLGSLDTYTAINDLHKLFSLGEEYDHAVAKVEAKLKGYLNPKMEEGIDQLANYLVHSEPGNNLARNAEEIANRNHINDPEVIKAIDALITLKALSKLEDNERALLNQLGEEHSDDFLKAYSLYLATRNDFLDSMSQGAKHNYMKGGFKINSSNRLKSVFVSASQKKKYDRLGYKVHSTVKINGGTYYWMTGHLATQAIMNAGIFQGNEKTGLGVNLETGEVLDGNGGLITNRELINELLQSDMENMSVVYDNDHNISAVIVYPPKDLIDSLKQDQSFHTRLGINMGVSHFNAVKDEWNTGVADRLFKDWEENGSKDPDAFINLNDALNDLPHSVKEAVKQLSDSAYFTLSNRFGGYDKIMVRKSQLDSIFGYRSASIRDLWTTKGDVYDAVRSIIAGFVDKLFGDKGYQYAVTAEVAVQNMVSFAKDIIVNRYPVVGAMNLVSNVIQLQLLGVPLGTIIREYPRKMAEIREYQKALAREHELELQIKVVKSDTELNKLEAQLALVNKALDRNKGNWSISPIIHELSTVTAAGDRKDIEKLFYGSWKEGLDEVADATPEGVKKILSEVLFTPGSFGHSMLSNMNQYGDFIAKSIIRDHYKKNGMGEDEAQALARQLFVDYDEPPGRTRKYLESLGLVWFTNYPIRITRTLMHLVHNNPLRLFLLLNAPHGFWDNNPFHDSLVKYFEGRMVLGWGLMFHALTLPLKMAGLR